MHIFQWEVRALENYHLIKRGQSKGSAQRERATTACVSWSLLRVRLALGPSVLSGLILMPAFECI